MGLQFVRPDTVRLALADVHRRAHDALLTRTPKKPTSKEIAASARRVATAEAEAAWIVVKRRLNAGEQRAHYARVYLAGVDGRLHVNPLQTGVSLILVYLIDWSAKDEQGEPVSLRGLSIDEVESILDGLAPESFSEIRQAIEWHEEAQGKARAAEKNGPDGEKNESAISPSPSEPAGPLTASVN